MYLSDNVMKINRVVMEVPSKHVSVIVKEARSIYETKEDYKSLTSFSTMACLLVASACGVSST